GFVIELPLLWLAFDKHRKPGRVLAAIALANAATALGLICWYGVASDLSLASRFDSVKEPAMVGLEGTREAKTEDGAGGAFPWVYYIARDGQTVRRVRLDGSEDERVGALPEAVENGGLNGGLRHDGGVDLLVRAHEFKELGQSQDWSQTAYRDFYERDSILLRNVGAAASVFDDHAPWVAPLDGSQDLYNDIHASPAYGLRISGTGMQERHFWLSSPLVFFSGPISASRVPGDVLVFQVGNLIGNHSRGINVASLDTMRIALLVEDGRAPCVVYDHPPPSWDADALLERLQNPR
ncbi:MAG: hypothetical protein RIE03_21115, partial [Pseudomonadales bacterium]